ncbi:MAG: S9 family peptidase [Candidatus Eisenbacteria bacterium]|nr:S9 family peptidase [Candidatus Eisenbacteria bacterium]
MREQDLLRFRWIADPRISPDGSRVAYTLVSVDEGEDEYRTNLWLCDVPADEGPSRPRQLTFAGRDSQPRWSPDGTQLAFTRKPEGEGPPQVHVLPLAGGEPRALTSLGGGAHSPAWSPDGSRLVFLSGHNPEVDQPGRPKPKHAPARVVTRPEFRLNDEGFTDWEHLDHLWVLALSGGEPRQLTCGVRFKESAPEWSHDGRWILYLTDRREEPWFGVPLEHNDLRAISPDLAAPSDGAESVLVADIAGPLAPFAQGPEGRIAAIGGIRPEPPRSYDQNDLLLLQGAWPLRSAEVLTHGRDLAVGETTSSDQHPPRGGGALPLAFTSDGGLLFGYGLHGVTRAARFDLASGRLDDLTGPEDDVVCGSASADGSRLALTVGGHRTPGDLVVVDVSTRRRTVLHRPNEELMAGANLGEVEEFWCESFDGRRVQGWIVKPPGFDPAKKYPLVLEIHGGPHAAYGNAFFHEFRVLAAAGYVVVYMNPRGSTTYGQAFADCIQYAYPGDDFHDLMAAVDHVLARGYVDESRLGVTGGSGGGLLTNWIVARTNRFRAAVTQRCVSDWASMYYSSDFALLRPFWFRRAPFEDPLEYAQRSPATDLARVETPLMVIHSEEDWRTPIAQGEVMFRGLKQQRKPVVMVRFPGENHELSRSGAPSRRVQNQQHIRRWFDRWLKDVPAPEYGI